MELKLRELTMERHKNAERSNFAKKLVSGKISADEYARYLYNMRIVYSSLETCAIKLRVMDGLEKIRRTSNIKSDLIELGNPQFNPYKSTIEYVDYLAGITDPEKILAHVYVRHMGDLSGGQIIANRIKDELPIKFYEFDEDTEVLKDKLREKLNNDMADEAMVAFDHAHKIFLELDAQDDLG
jgi:heme oxygenase